MANIYDDIDAKFNWNGDYDLGPDGDIADTSSDGLLSLRQDLHTICASSLRDWELYPGLGATLDDFVGEPNNRTTAEAIHDRLKISIVSAGIVQDGDLDIKIVPVHRSKVLIIIKINAAATPFNKLEVGQRLATALVFDYMEQGMYFLDKNPMIATGVF